MRLRGSVRDVDEVGPHLDDDTDSIFSGEPKPDRGTPHPMLR